MKPHEATWDELQGGQASLFQADAAAHSEDTPAPRHSPETSPPPRVPRAFLEAARVVCCHRSDDRFDLLYRVLYRLSHGEPALLDDAADADVLDLSRRKAAVLRDVHKVHAFVRFRKISSPPADAPEYVAWHEPAHRCLSLAAPFFVRRFPAMRWAILTPEASVFWDGRTLHERAGATREQAPTHDELEDLFSTYWRSIYNPARINLPAMKKEMPVRHWSTLPETAHLAEMIRESAGRVQTMGELPKSSAEAFLPEERSLPTLRAHAERCTACALHEAATHTVFGEGPETARLMLVGEQPGDEEDRRGRAFVGPAGRLLDEILREAGVPRATTYVTNAVKHFKFEMRGKRRIHSKPAYTEVVACRAWLDAEIEQLQPQVIVCLGATAAQSFMGRRYALTRSRGRIERTRFAQAWIATWHPSALLRADDATSARMRAEMVADLRLAYAQLMPPVRSS